MYVEQGGGEGRVGVRSGGEGRAKEFGFVLKAGE